MTHHTFAFLIVSFALWVTESAPRLVSFSTDEILSKATVVLSLCTRDSPVEHSFRTFRDTKAKESVIVAFTLFVVQEAIFFGVSVFFVCFIPTPVSLASIVRLWLHAEIAS